MMSASEEQILIESLRPENPNIPPGTTLLPLHPVTLWPVGSIKNVLVLPGEIDIDRFTKTLQKLTSIWPNIVGRFVKTGDRSYAIKITSSPLPFTKAILEQDSIYPTSNVVQPSLAPFVAPLPESFIVPDYDSPLVSIQLTTLLPSRRSVIGITWGHIIGDGANCNEFISQLSYLYSQNDESKGIPRERYPSFFPHIQSPRYPPIQQVKDKWEKWYNAPVPIQGSEGMMARYGKAGEEYEMLTITLRREEIRALKRNLSAGLQEIKLSEQDCLSAWWIHVLECTEKPDAVTSMKMVGNSVNYRHLAGTHPYFPTNLPTLSANVAQMIGTPLVGPDKCTDPIERIRINAKRIRQTLIEIRTNPEETIDWLSVSASQLEESLVNSQAQCLVPPLDECMVNSNLRYEWIQPFGFPWDQTAYHTSACLPRFLRVFQANPKKGDEKGETDVELIWSIRKGSKELIERVVNEDREKWMR